MDQVQKARASGMTEDGQDAGEEPLRAAWDAATYNDAKNRKNEMMRAVVEGRTYGPGGFQNRNERWLALF